MRTPASNRLFLAAIAAVTVCLWGGLNRPVAEAPWPARVDGYAFSPLRAGADPARTPYPGRDEIAADLALIADHAHSLRSYSLQDSLADIPALAEPLGLDVTAGVWLDRDAKRNGEELAALRALLPGQSNVERVLVGNETLLRGDLSIAALSGVLDELRAEFDVPMSTAEPWHIWLANPELAEHVDFIGVHLLPYWEGVHVDDAVDFIAARMSELQARFPDLPVLIAEVGWPSRGRSRGDAEPSYVNAERFLRRFMQRAQAEGYDYYLMEAFDQPWKRADEGEVGAYWGAFDVRRQAKFAFAGPLVPIPAWPWLALLAVLAAGASFRLMLADGNGMNARGRAFVAVTVTALASATLLSLHGFVGQYWTPQNLAFGALLVAGLTGVVILALVEAHEWAQLRWSARQRAHGALRVSPAAALPKVSIHLPTHREPPAMVADTLRALAALDYPNFEVLVVDNNTADERMWRPIEALCASDDRLHFFHVDKLAGYKAGALNYALARTAADADVVAVIDSDYKVDPAWLRDLAGHFRKPAVGIVQAPQAYRDGGLSLFKRMCKVEYDGFFKVGMVTRNDRNAIIQHGTMTMIRKSVLRDVGGWAEWTVTEDAELGLRVLEHGHEAVYVPQCYGRGLTPDNFNDYKVQRFRWALGAMQILRRHGRELLGLRPSRLSLGQRFHFLTGWLGWLADGCNLLFNGVAVIWSLLMIAAPLRFEPPLVSFSAFVLALFAFKLAKMMYLYRTEVRAGWLATFGAAMAGLALVYVVGRAVLAGLGGQQARFFRTPKLARRHSLSGAAAACRGEALLAFALIASAFGVAWRAPFTSNDLYVWMTLLCMLAVPHLAAVGMSLISALPSGRKAQRAPQLAEPATDARRS